MHWFNTFFLPELARVCLVCMFPFSGIDKIIHWDGAMKQASSSFLPCAPCLLIMGMTVEFLTPLCIIFGWHDHIATVVLAGYCAITAILYHNFWAYPDFWARGDSVARTHFWDFTKNFCVVGGLLLLLDVSGFHTIPNLIGHPLASAPMTAAGQ